MEKGQRLPQLKARFQPKAHHLNAFKSHCEIFFLRAPWPLPRSAPTPAPCSFGRRRPSPRVPLMPQLFEPRTLSSSYDLSCSPAALEQAGEQESTTLICSPAPGSQPSSSIALSLSSCSGALLGQESVLLGRIGATTEQESSAPARLPSPYEYSAAALRGSPPSPSAQEQPSAVLSCSRRAAVKQESSAPPCSGAFGEPPCSSYVIGGVARDHCHPRQPPSRAPRQLPISSRPSSPRRHPSARPRWFQLRLSRVRSCAGALSLTVSQLLRLERTEYRPALRSAEHRAC
jgi:hypothetical protein